MSLHLRVLAGLMAVIGLLTISCTKENGIGLDSNELKPTITAAINTNTWYALLSPYDSANGVWRAIDLDVSIAVGNGSKVHMWDFHGGDNQYWKFVSTGNGYYKIINKAYIGLALDADVAPGPMADGTKIHMWEYFGNENQQWEVTLINGIATLRSKTNRNLVIDRDIAQGINNGDKVQIWSCTGNYGSLNQRWILFPLGGKLSAIR